MNKTAIVAGVVALLVGGGAGVGWGFSAAEAARREQQGKIDALQQQLDAANAKAKSERDKAEQAALDLKSAQDAAAAFQKKALADITSAVNHANELLVRARTLESDLTAAKDRAIAQVTSIQALAQAKVDEAMKAVAGMQATLQTSLAQSSETAKAEINRLNGMLSDQKKNLDGLQGQITGLQNQVAELPVVKQNLASAQQEAAQWKQRADEANARAQSLDQRVGQLTEEIKLLRQSGVKGLLGGNK